jgi:O-antigen/teichoic acid export membrane protein
MSMAVETLVVSLCALHLLRAGVLCRASAGDVPFTLRDVNRFYIPLLVMTVLLVTTRPILIGGLARLPEPETVIAAWSVVLSITMLFSNHARGFQHMAIALADDHECFERIARFARLVGLASTGALALVAVAPPGTWFLRSVMGIEDSLLVTVRYGIFLTCLVPIMRAIQNSIRGVLVRVGATKTTNLIALSNACVLVVGTVMIAWLQLPGVMTTAALFGAAYVVEALVLLRTLRPKTLPVLSAYAP